MTLAMFTDVAVKDYEEFRVGLGGLLASTESIATINGVTPDTTSSSYGFEVDDGSSPGGGTAPALDVQSDSDSRNTRVVFWARIAGGHQADAWWKQTRRVVVTLDVTTSTGREIVRGVAIEVRAVVLLDAA